MKINIFPVPANISFSKSTFDMSCFEWIFINNTFSHNLKGHILELSKEINSYFSIKLQVTSGSPSKGKILLSVEKDSEKYSSQSYSIISSSRGILLSAGGEAGIFYGLQTLKQIFQQVGSQIPKFKIIDQADFEERGIMLDISRCKVPTMSSLKKYIDILASLKLNQLQLYTEHTFAFSDHETVWHDASPITASEIIELEKYCSERYITLVPNFNSFGHLGRWLKHSEYKHLAECPDGFEYSWGEKKEHGEILYPSQKSLDFIDSLYKEMLPNFSTKLFNIGCDETFELGKGRSSDAVEKDGEEKVYFDFLVKLSKLTQKHNRTMMFWGDIILKKPELIKELPKNTIALDWGYEPDHPFDKECANFASASVPFYVCPGTSSWNSILGRTEKARLNLENAAKNGMKYAAVGYLITDWGDGGHHQYPSISYPGILVGACFSWCLKSNKNIDTSEALNQMIFQDKTKIFSDLLLEVGRVAETIPVEISNASIFGKSLFMKNEHLKDLIKDIPLDTIKKALEVLKKLKAQICLSRPEAEDADLLKLELSASIEMAEFSLKRIISIITKRKNKNLLKELQHIIMVHENLWLQRNRPGGLSESLNKLREIKKHIS